MSWNASLIVTWIHWYASVPTSHLLPCHSPLSLDSRHTNFIPIPSHAPNLSAPQGLCTCHCWENHIWRFMQLSPTQSSGLCLHVPSTEMSTRSWCPQPATQCLTFFLSLPSCTIMQFDILHLFMTSGAYSLLPSVDWNCLFCSHLYLQHWTRVSGNKNLINIFWVNEPSMKI